MRFTAAICLVLLAAALPGAFSQTGGEDPNYVASYTCQPGQTTGCVPAHVVRKRANVFWHARNDKTPIRVRLCPGHDIELIWNDGLPHDISLASSLKNACTAKRTPITKQPMIGTKAKPRKFVMSTRNLKVGTYVFISSVAGDCLTRNMVLRVDLSPSFC